MSSVETLADRIARDGPLNELDAVGWIIRLARKLETLHARGLAHGSVSPAAVKTAGVPRTSLGILAGIGAAPAQRAFMSPERVAQGGVTAADDTWATAATLFALLTGHSPFSAPDEETVSQKVLNGMAAPLSLYDVGDDDLQHILDAALARNAAERASTMAALRQALEAWHPDPTVRELPALSEDQGDDDEDERTVMRPAVAMNAMRAATTKATVPNMPAVNAALAKASHGLLEDEDDDNAKTAMMKVGPGFKPLPIPARGGPASQPRPAVAPAVQPRPGGTAVMPALGPRPGPAARAPQSSRLGGTQPMQAVPAAPAAPPKPAEVTPAQGISRAALIDDIDDEATVMREAPLELLMKAGKDDEPTKTPEADRVTPVNPIPAEVAASAARDDDGAMLEKRAPTPLPPVLQPDVRPPEPTMLLSDDDDLAATRVADPLPAPSSSPQFADPRASAPRISDPRISEPSAARISAPAELSANRISAPAELSANRISAPVAPAGAPAFAPDQSRINTGTSMPMMTGAAPAPLTPMPPAMGPGPVAGPWAAPQPAPPASSSKGLLIGVGLGLLVIVLVAVGLFVLK